MASTDEPVLLAPILLNSPLPSSNGVAKKPNPKPSLEPSPMILRSSGQDSSNIVLDDMEPPPPIPAAVEESGFRSRPSSRSTSRPASPHSVRFKDTSSDGYITPNRRGSVATESTTAWEACSPGGSPIAGPSTSKARRRLGGFFRGSHNPSSSSLDAGDEAEFDGVATPFSRRSIEYSRRKSAGYSTGDEVETPIVAKRPGLFTKLKNFGHGSHGRSHSGWTEETVDDATPTGPLSPVTTSGYSPAIGGTLDEYEEFGDNRDGMRSPGSLDGTRTTPATPRIPGPRRRATITDLPGEARASEGRSSSRLAYSRRTSFKRITQFNHRRQSHDERPAASSAGGHHSASASKWRALKAGIRAMGQRKKEESKIDRQKSAQLMAELAAGTPAVLILASMFQRDEYGHRRVPILLEQVKVKITDSTEKHGRSMAHTVFRIELEYGSGLTRMKWVIHREFRDFFNLHSRYRLTNLSNANFVSSHDNGKLPHFPKSTIPFIGAVRALGSEDEHGDTEASGGEGNTTAESAVVSPVSPKKKKPLLRRRSSSVVGEQDVASGVAAGLLTLTAAVGGPGVTGITPGLKRKEVYSIKQREELGEYLANLIGIMKFRPDSNRLCKFLELSALGVRLAAEGSYHGKEGYLVIRSSKGSDFRRAWNPAAVAKRHSPKWFLVRHSYIVCVDSPEEMNIYDVFLVDSKFEVETKRFLRKKAKDISVPPSSNAAHPQHHSLSIQNSERQLKLLAKTERQLHQFNQSILYMKLNTPWAQQQRFGSFSPVRKGVFAQWLVDGRDYMWNVSRAISMAKDVIYIHDWWLSPELYLRRPAAVSQKWRLDRLLQRKAQEGVKIFVIVYRNIGAAIPIDSAYTKYSLLDLHPNVFVQRSPNQIRQATFFWAHHEKILIVDHMVAFVGGIDLCFGRWDTPQHSLVDDKPTGFEEGSQEGDPENFQLWPGKDYSNPRVQDFYNLDKPYEEMYDRQKVPRMPWHDIHMQVVGQPARDLTRHFVQRWNYLLRQRTPSRPTPVLLPPPDFTQIELESLGIDGTCEVQILRSACSWSLGTANTTEHSIMNAYIKSIEMSEHFVYIENQFFITSCEWGGTVIENKIGDALVERIIRAYRNDEDWRACIIIPLMPGFQNSVDSQDGTSIRLIMQCQYRSISRGESSIFGRLRAQNIEPDDFIQFYGLRNWGKIGPTKTLVTEQLYIHAKCMVVDDRIAIIGSANINERSMLGNRDSEVAAIVRDTDTILSTMAGKPFRVGKFPHTLRIRLMREHLGMDVDGLMSTEREEESHRKEEQWEEQVRQWQKDKGHTFSTEGPQTPTQTPFSGTKIKVEDEVVARTEELRSFNHDVDWEQENNPNLKARKKETSDGRITNNSEHKKDVLGLGLDHMKDWEAQRARKPKGPAVPVKIPPGERMSSPTNLASPISLKASLRPQGSSRSSSRASTFEGLGNGNLPPPPGPNRATSYELGLPLVSQLPPLPATSDQDIGGPCYNRPTSLGDAAAAGFPLLQELRLPTVDPDMFTDPLNDSFYLDVWQICAQNNTKIYRQVFRCMPDNEVKTWAAYKDYALYSERFSQSQGGGKSKIRRQQESQGKSGPPGTATSCATTDGTEKIGSIGETMGEIPGINIPNPPPTNTNSNNPNNEKNQHGNVKEWTSIPQVQNQDEPEIVQTDGTSPPPMNEKVEYRPYRPYQPTVEDLIRPRSTSHTSSKSRLNTATTTNTTATQESKQDPNMLSSGIGSVQYANSTSVTNTGSTKRRRRGTTRSSKRDFMSDEIVAKDVAENLLNKTQGHLVVWPHDWLVREEEAGNWLYSIDQLAPIEIYD